MADRFAAVDALAAEFQARGGQPGLAYGVVAGGELAHAGGLGERWAGGPPPDEGAVFRIASMTKSFTAAAVLLLRDEGALALDDLAQAHVPEVTGLGAPADAPPITVRRLLTMTAGLPTDDPWGDRQQGLPPADFAEFLAGGASFAWTPGTWFEYSNLGYAILGRVVSAASGMDYAEFVRRRLLEPLGMSRTGFDAGEFSPGQLARGHRRGAEAWQELVPDPYGAFAPMGGVFSCVSDLARWVAGFAAAAGGPGGGDEHPLRRASRLEMQTAQVTIPPVRATGLPGGPVGGGPAGYGLGLFVEHDPALGAVVQHSGGYPGFGSNMRWHPASGLGVVVLANSTYAGATFLAARMLDALARERAEAPQVFGPAPAGPWPRVLAAREEASRLLADWDDAAADRLFSENVAQDGPYAERRAAIATLRERIGDFAPDPDRPPEHDSPAHCRWWLRGERGTVAAEILLTPELKPRVCKLAVAVPPAPGSPLAAMAALLLEVANGGGPGPLHAAPAAASLDTALLVRQLRMAGAWAGRCVPGAFRAGNGDTTVTVELDGEHARLALWVIVDSAGALQQAQITIR